MLRLYNHKHITPHPEGIFRYPIILPHTFLLNFIFWLYKWIYLCLFDLKMQDIFSRFLCPMTGIYGMLLSLGFFSSDYLIPFDQAVWGRLLLSTKTICTYPFHIRWITLHFVNSFHTDPVFSRENENVMCLSQFIHFCNICEIMNEHWMDDRS